MRSGVVTFAAATATMATSGMSTGVGLIVGGGARALSTSADMFCNAGGVDVINVDQLVIIEGLVVVTGAGNIELYHASETLNNTSVMQDSALILTKIA